MSTDKDKNNNDNDIDTGIKPLTELINLTDRTLNQMFRGISSIYSNYHDSVEDTLSTAIPTVLKETSDELFRKTNDWFSDFDRISRENFGESITERASKWYEKGGEFGDRLWPELFGPRFGPLTQIQIGLKSIGNNQFEPIKIDLDESKPTDLVSFPIPTTRKYTECKELKGQSVWTREGIWRCLFPKSSLDKSQLSQALDKASSISSQSSNGILGALTSSDKSNNVDELQQYYVFPDFTSYLDWKSEIRKAMEYKLKQDRKKYSDVYPEDSTSRAITPIRNNTSYISEEEAEKLGKKVVSSCIESRTITTENGDLETKKVVRKWYDDGTASISEYVNTTPKESSGWFWKRNK